MLIPVNFTTFFMKIKSFEYEILTPQFLFILHSQFVVWQGFKDVYNMGGGYLEWVKKEFPVKIHVTE